MGEVFFFFDGEDFGGGLPVNGDGVPYFWCEESGVVANFS